MTFVLQVSDDGLDGGKVAQFALDDTEDAALLTGEEDAAGFCASWPRYPLSAYARSIGQPVSVSVRSMTSRKL